MPRLQLSFHTTFALTKKELLKILQNSLAGKLLKDTTEKLTVSLSQMIRRWIDPLTLLEQAYAD